MRNAEWFRNRQTELRKQNEAQLKRQKIVEEQWTRIVQQLDSVELEADDKYIEMKEKIFDENVDKLQSEDLGFFVNNSNYISRIYFREQDYIADSNDLYNIHDKEHTDKSRIDDVFNRGLSRRKAGDYVYKRFNEKAGTPKKETIKEEPKIGFKYLKDGKLKEWNRDEELYKELKKIFNLF